MTDDITKNMSDSEKLDFIINAVSDTNRRMAAMEERQTVFEQRLTSLETLVQNRLHDTRPIWEAVLKQLETLQQQQQVQQEQLNRLEQGQYRLVQKLKILIEGNLEMRTDLNMLTKRVDDLEDLRQAA